MADRRRRKNSKRMSIKRRRRMRALFGLVLLCAVFIIGVSWVVLHKYVSKVPDDKICNNVYIGTVNVSGKTKKEAKKLMETHLAEDGAKTLTLNVDGEKADAVLNELGLSYANMDAVINKALEYGKKGSLLKRVQQIKGLEKKKLVLAEGFILDSEKSTAVLTERAVPLASHAVDAQIEKSADGFVIKDEKSGETVDIDASVKKITDYINGDWKHDNFSLKMVLKKENPAVRRKDLESIKDALGTFSTDAGGGERWQNLKTGVDRINGTVLMPGQQFSVHDATAPYDAEHGYTEAGSYENGQVVDSFGGGICQVSTTLYNAVLYAELEVVERYPHSMLVNYVKPSRDAAIAGDYLDLVFKNNYDTPVYIECGIDAANQMWFTVYGKETRDKARKVEYESETLTTEDYGVTYKENPDADLGAMEYTGSPHTGRTARLWKVVYQNGEEVSRDIINNSTYEKSDQIIKVGTKTDNPDAAALVKKAIESQDKGTIESAVSEAKALQ